MSGRRLEGIPAVHVPRTARCFDRRSGLPEFGAPASLLVRCQFSQPGSTYSSAALIVDQLYRFDEGVHGRGISPGAPTVRAPTGDRRSRFDDWSRTRSMHSRSDRPRSRRCVQRALEPTPTFAASARP